LKIAFYTNFPKEPSSWLHKNCFFKKNLDIELFKLSKINKYNYIFFMPYKKDLEDMIKLKKINNNFKSCIVDPRIELKENVIKSTDLIIVDSIEMEDFFKRYNKPIFKYCTFPQMDFKVLKNKSNVYSIGYHGNLDHLNEMRDDIINAISDLSKIVKIKLIFLYNFNKFGKFKKKIGNCEIKHIQWNNNNISKFINSIDIGIVPNLKKQSFLKKNFFKKVVNYNLNFKLSSGPGRILLFAYHKIPVVADMYPSSLEFIKNDKNGYVCFSKESWFFALKNLISSKKKKIGYLLYKKLFPYYLSEKQNIRLNVFLKKN
jgi:hypothetical protein